MEFKANVKYDGAPADAVKVLMSPELAAARTRALEISDYSFEGGESTAITRISVKHEELPDEVKHFLRTGLQVELTATLNPTGNQISHTVVLTGIPASIYFDATLADAAGTTSAEYAGDVTVSIPLLGRKLEQVAVEQVAALLADDARLVNKLL